MWCLCLNLKVHQWGDEVGFESSWQNFGDRNCKSYTRKLSGCWRTCLCVSTPPITPRKSGVKVQLEPLHALCHEVSPAAATGTNQMVIFSPQQQYFAMRSLAQISSGAIWCSFNTRFRARFRRVQKVPAHMLRLGSGRFWCGVAEGSGAETRWGSGGFRRRA